VLCYSCGVAQKILPGLRGKIVTISKSNKATEYEAYARHCLNVVAKIPDQASRMIHREMAAEWFNLADQAAEDATLIMMSDHAPKKTGTARS
jgi:hypothetical protein